MESNGNTDLNQKEHPFRCLIPLLNHKQQQGLGIFACLVARNRCALLTLVLMISRLIAVCKNEYV